MKVEDVEIAYSTIVAVQNILSSEIQDVTNSTEYREQCAEKMLLLSKAKEIIIDFESELIA